MATVQRRKPAREIEYPTGDGKPMAETDVHRKDMTDLIQTLDAYHAPAREVYVSGNLLMYYQEGDRRKHVAPDVFLVRGVKKHDRECYLVWEEEKAPDFVTEITSKSTRREDQNKKFAIYRDILKVREYFLFDPTGDYLDPPLQGYRLIGGEYVRIEPVEGRLPSEVLGLHLERDGTKLRLFNPVTREWLPTLEESRDAERHRAEAERHRAEAERHRADEQQRQAVTERHRADEQQRQAEAERHRADAAEAARRRDAEELERLRREIEALRGG
jgi:Uma2 family endonuclease